MVGIPHNWILNSFQVAKNFTLDEFESPDTGEVKIVPELVYKLQKVRDRLKKPIQITSGYRTPEHNKAVGGAPNSYHMYGLAADIIVWGESRLKVARICQEVGFTCIILYPDKPHIHVDLREDYKGIVVYNHGKLVPLDEWKGRWVEYQKGKIKGRISNAKKKSVQTNHSG